MNVTFPFLRLVRGALLLAAAGALTSCALFRDYSRLEPQVEATPTDWIALGDAAYEREEYAQAVVWYRAGALRGYQVPIAWFNAANALMRLNRPADAREAYRRAVEAAPNFLKARQNLAALYQLEGNMVDAARHYEAAARLDSADANSRFRLGELAQQAGDPAEALRYYEAALRADPLHEGAASGMAQALLSGRDTSTALVWIQDFNARTPKPVSWSVILEADLSLQAGLREQAAQLYREAAAANPSDARPWMRLAKMLRQEGKPLEAGIVLGQALRAAPQRGELWAALGSLRFEGGDPSGARDAYLRAFRLGSADGFQGLQMLITWHEKRHEASAAQGIRDSVDSK
jgi:tetratricopeptide (TPR) repeat protein